MWLLAFEGLGFTGLSMTVSRPVFRFSGLLRSATSCKGRLTRRFFAVHPQGRRCSEKNREA